MRLAQLGIGRRPEWDSEGIEAHSKCPCRPLSDEADGEVRPGRAMPHVSGRVSWTEGPNKAAAGAGRRRRSALMDTSHERRERRALRTRRLCARTRSQTGRRTGIRDAAQQSDEPDDPRRRPAPYDEVRRDPSPRPGRRARRSGSASRARSARARSRWPPRGTARRPPGERQHRERDSERGGRMVAGERRVGRARGEQVRQGGMVGEWPWPRPEAGDRLVHGEGHGGGGQRRRRGEPPLRIAVGTSEQPQRNGRERVRGTASRRAR